MKAAAALSTRERLLCESLYFLGCRVSEALQLTPTCVDVGESVILIRCLKKRGKEVTRRVLVPKRLAKELVDLGAQAEERLWPISRMTAWRIVKRVMAVAGISGIHAMPKGLRHGFGVRAALAKLPLHLIQRYMGHSYSTTTAIYLDVVGDEERTLVCRTWR
ncbi:site-specific integrase [Luteolibacter ambystomatis]|uniref:Site-specific integrase n=1 Tax=Luteolibacter ambystomatis TaxID=2824561 RepID=A0A975PFW4_9BACT|nr:site-specific integrase [Luteolibacter ambystomatis]